MKKITLKNLFESINGLRAEAKKPYYIKSAERNTRTYVVSGAPLTTTGDEVYKSLLDICQSHGAVVKHSESGDISIRFYYKEDWTSLESRILKEGVGELESTSNSLYRELFECLEEEIDSLGIGMNVAILGTAYVSVEEYLETLKTSVKTILTSMNRLSR